MNNDNEKENNETVIAETESEKEDDEDWGYPREHYLWCKLDEKKYIRRNIFFKTNLSDYSSATLIHTNVNLKVSFDKIAEEEDRYDYINSENFKRCYKKLIMCILAIDSFSSNATLLFLSKIFDLCNVVAFDLMQKIIIILYNCQIYIIFYGKENKYIKLDLSDTTTPSIANVQCIQHEVQKFIYQFNASYIYNYCMTKKYSGDEKSVFNKFVSLITKSIKYLLPSLSSLPSSVSMIEMSDNCSNDNSNSSNINEKWSNWVLVSDFLQWRTKAETYSRCYVHFKFNLNDIYHIGREKTKMKKTYSLKTVCENLLIFNYLYIYNEALIYNNVIHIDFKNYIFITLKIIEENLCEFTTVSFSPNSSGPLSNFIFNVPHDQMCFHEFMSYIV